MYLQRRWKWTTSTKIHGWQKGNSEIVIILYVNCSLETESLCLVGTTEESNDAVRIILARSTGDGGRVYAPRHVLDGACKFSLLW